MSPEHEAALRHSFERFVPLPDDAWAEIRQPWHLRTVRRGEHLRLEGEVEQTFSLVLEGVQRMYFTGPDGAEHTVAVVYPPDYSGVPDSFFLRTPSAYAIVAVTDGRMLSVGYDDFTRLLGRHRALERWAWRLFLAAGAGRAKRERDWTTLSAAERYGRLLRESPQVVQHLPLKHVASYLGMSPETLSRIRADGS